MKKYHALLEYTSGFGIGLALMLTLFLYMIAGEV